MSQLIQTLDLHLGDGVQFYVNSAAILRRITDEGYVVPINITPHVASLVGKKDKEGEWDSPFWNFDSKIRLRPLSSMTDEEAKAVVEICDSAEQVIVQDKFFQHNVVPFDSFTIAYKCGQFGYNRFCYLDKAPLGAYLFLIKCGFDLGIVRKEFVELVEKF